MALHAAVPQQKGLSLVELMIAMAVGLVIVGAATAIYLSTAQNQRALERQSASLESGAFALQLLGRDLMNAGAYPANFPTDASDAMQQGMYDTYPPLEFTPRKATDWQNKAINWPPLAYMTGIYGCEGAEFDVKTATCPAPNAGKPDSIVINYFTSDATGSLNGRVDCTGAAVDGDTSNSQRRKAGGNANQPPMLPLFVSNRYALKDLKNYVDRGDVATYSLACSGNGSSRFGELSNYQPIIQGLKDLKFLYGVYTGDASLSPARFYTATEVSNLAPIKISGQMLTGWQRVTAVRVCVLSQSQGGGARVADKAGAEKTYLDCSDTARSQPVGQWVHRFVQIFGVRNGLKQSY